MYLTDSRFKPNLAKWSIVLLTKSLDLASSSLS